MSTFRNYGELYERNLGEILPRSDTNRINNGSLPLIYSIPFGNTDTIVSPVPGGTLEAIEKRGYLRCGISERAIFAHHDFIAWEGFDIDFCKAVSAAVFGGVTSTIEYVDISAAERFVELNNGGVDVLSRLTTITLSRDVYEPTSRSGNSFSQPNFYDGMHFGGIEP